MTGLYSVNSKVQSSNGEKFALKTIKIQLSEQSDRLAKEIEAHSKVSSPYVLVN